MTDSHWVEDLYPPRFGYKDYEELTKPVEEVRTMLDKLLDRITIVNTESIRDIYVNVLAMVTAQERTTPNAVARMVNASAQTDLSATTIGSLNTQSGVRDKKLWTSMEQALLRDHYLKEHEDYLATRAELMTVKGEEAAWSEEVKDARQALARNNDVLAAKDAAINRLKLVNTSLRTEIVRIMKLVTDSEAELKDLKEKYKLAVSQQREASTALNEIHIKYKLVEGKLNRVHEEATLEADRQIAASKLKYEAGISDLTDRINNLTESLDIEQELHNRCKQGLQVLRLHYSNSNNIQSVIDGS